MGHDREEVEYLEDAISTLEEEVATLNDKIDSLEDEISGLNDDVQALEDRDLTDAYNDAPIGEKEYVIAMAIQDGHFDDEYVIVSKRYLQESDAFALSINADIKIINFFKRVLTLVGCNVS